MIKEAINRILELSAPSEIDYAGAKFVDKKMERLPKCQLACALPVNTLSAIVEYIKRGADKEALGVRQRFVIHVKDYNSVSLYRELNEDKGREELLRAEISNSSFPFGRFLDMETFIINLQANFVQSDSRDSLVRLAGNIVSDSGVSQADDGISQQVTVRNGISLVGNEKVPNPITLSPYRTFTEIGQPASSFVFRLRKERDESASMALFEADGEAWKRTAILSIAEWFSERLSGKDVIVLA